MSDTLNTNEDLTATGAITSSNSGSTLVMQGDGNLVLYRPGGRARWATNTAGRSVSQAIMQGDGNFVMYGPGGEYIWDTATDGHPGARLVVQNDGNIVIYDPDGNALWATNTDIVHQAVPGFLPSTSGFHFSNSSFDHVPPIKIDILGNQIGIGDAANGLCGGMVFAARDCFEAGVPIPPDTAAPSSGPLFDYIVKRLLDSFNLILPAPPLPFMGTPTPPLGPGPYTYMWLMNPALADHETDASKLGLSPHGRAWIMVKEEWPKIKADIDNSRLSPVGMVEVKSLDPTQLGKNHQVLVYGYDLDGTDVTLRLYDPNAPDSDSVTMSFSTANPEHTTAVLNSIVPTVWCFFRPAYNLASLLPDIASHIKSWQHIGHANGVAAMAAINGKLFAATSDNRLWWRDPVGNDVSWEHIGHANDVVAMAAINGKLFAATRDNRLWWRDPVGHDVNWEHIGHANDVAAMAAINGKLFAATRDNRLWWRAPVGHDVSWEHIGHANDVAAMAAINGKLFAATRDNRLWWREPM